MPNIIEQKPEYLLLGALGVGLGLFYLAGRHNVPAPLPNGSTTVTTTPPSNGYDAGTVQQLIDQNFQQQQGWVIDYLNRYYAQYNGQPPAPSPTYPGPTGDTTTCPDGEFMNVDGICVRASMGGDGPPKVEAYTGRRWQSLGIRSIAGGF